LKDIYKGSLPPFGDYPGSSWLMSYADTQTYKQCLI
jgi:hypothetical protein